MDTNRIPISHIRNFSIIAHIDHGKSTLADRILELSEMITQRDKKDQILDSMDLERERGITIKSNSASFLFTSKNKEQYLFNLIDTPGHVDFSYEVARSLAACEGVLLLIDATQGIQAQTIANFYLALEADLMIVPVINKIDLPAANIEKTRKQLDTTLGLGGEDAVCVSAKTGMGILELVEAIIQHIPAPTTHNTSGLQAIIYDAYYDAYRGVIEKIRIYDGSIQKNDEVYFINKKRKSIINEIGICQLDLVQLPQLYAGQVGYIITGIKNVSEVMLGDTIVHPHNTKPITSVFKYKEVKPMVFSGLFPIDAQDYNKLKDSIEKLALNDAALTFEPESSNALGFGFRVGYLGILHMEIVKERLEREFGLYLLTTAPSVKYHVYGKDNTYKQIDNPSQLPESTQMTHIEEPYVKTNIITPVDYVGNILELLQEHRGEHQSFNYIDAETVQIIYLVPLAEMILKFYNQLKGLSKGYASLDYELNSYRKSELVKLDILVHQVRVDALSTMVHKKKADTIGREMIQTLKNAIKKHQFQIALQATVGSKVIARENITALRKNVTAKCYGGDVTRKRKLLEKQKEGKKKMKMVGNVEIPQAAFLSVLKND